MAVQNSYNNFISRGVKKPTNNFKEKVKNSLGGVPVQQKLATPTTNLTTPPTSLSKPIQPYNNTNTPKATPNPITTPPVANNTSTTPNSVAPQPTTSQTTPQATPQATTEGQGLVPISEINNSFNTPQENNAPTDVNAPITPQQVMEVANNPDVQRQAYATGKTPQQMAQELLEQQKAQLQKDWEQKQAEIKLQQEQAQASFEQSKVDADKAYGESIDAINQDRYNRQQDLNISGTKRGIQYSPQQLGLETVANINTNKNVTEAGKQRNELLSKLQEQINQLNANILMSSQGAMNEYNKALAGLQSDYANQMMNWAWNQQQTDDERKWQQAQTEADRAWQEKMDKADKDWQEKMADKNKSGRSSGYGGSSYSRGGRSYSNYYSGGMNGYSASGRSYSGDSFSPQDDIDRQVYDNEFKQASTDTFNPLNVGGMMDLNDRARAYMALTQDRYDYGKGDSVTKERMDTTRNTALKHLQTESYARDTNTPYNIGNTVYQPKTPINDDFKKKIMSTKNTDRNAFDKKYNIKRPDKEKVQQKFGERAESLHSKVMSSSKNKSKTLTKSSTSSKHTVKKSTYTRGRGDSGTTSNKKTTTKKTTTNKPSFITKIQNMFSKGKNRKK